MKPVRVIKANDAANDVKKVATSPKNNLKSMRNEFKRRLRTFEAEMLRQFDAVIHSLKD